MYPKLPRLRCFQLSKGRGLSLVIFPLFLLPDFSLFDSGMMRRGVWPNMDSAGYSTAIKYRFEYYQGYTDGRAVVRAYCKTE
ncbi:hypothetical protein OESDEN_13158 [Oesophagostomum dentatum]|uniref:Uncharacterized protein n=1 Tax=Oesophagostomum dentatum TaxID=61180 RepID=A0A0B1ST63_OESDE|nr:hypothetical protein OESDEN_13158 [Oesophagostomum dentatum]